jgi:hypothetical protein
MEPCNPGMVLRKMRAAIGSTCEGPRASRVGFTGVSVDERDMGRVALGECKWLALKMTTPLTAR